MLTNIDLAGIAARELLEKLGFTSHPYDAFKIAHQLGFEIDTERTFDNFSHCGSIDVGIGNNIIFVNTLLNDGMQNFLVAHEIGHYILHILPKIYKVQSKIFIDTFETIFNEDKSIEVEANIFASELLMPRDKMFYDGDKVFRNYGRSSMPVNLFIKEMAKRFNVGERVMRTRLKVLGIIGK